MPYIGTRHRTNDLLVTTKIYGPTSTFAFDPKDVLHGVKEISESYVATQGKKLAAEIARYVARIVSYDDNAVHVECEVLQGDGILFGAIEVLQE